MRTCGTGGDNSQQTPDGAVVFGYSAIVRPPREKKKKKYNVDPFDIYYRESRTPWFTNSGTYESGESDEVATRWFDELKINSRPLRK